MTGTSITEVIRLSETIDDTVYRIVSEVAKGKLTHEEVTEIAIRCGAIDHSKEQQTFWGQTKAAFAPYKGRIVAAIVTGSLAIGAAVVQHYTKVFTGESHVESSNSQQD